MATAVASESPNQHRSVNTIVDHNGSHFMMAIDNYRHMVDSLDIWTINRKIDGELDELSRLISMVSFDT